MDFQHLKSGTDIRGAACEFEGQPITLTDDVIRKIVSGFALWLIKRAEKQGKTLTVSVGHDSRVSAPRIKAACIDSLTQAGFTVLDCGLSSTPAMFMTTVDLACDGAVQITASHHPYYRNGLKFFTRSGGLDSPDISEILQYAESNQKPDENPGRVELVDYMKQYAARLASMICKGVGASDYDHPLKGFKIIVDAGNGAGGFYEKILRDLGADTTGSQFLEPDGLFPNHIPNPENEEAMRSVCQATVRHKADLGVIFDTDVDRAGCVDQLGREINKNRLVAMAAAIALESDPGGTIVTDSITSSGLKTFIEQDLGGIHHRFKRGYKNVINESLRLNAQGINSPLAIETSGHAALKENYFLDDGAYLITKIIIKMARLRREGKALDDLIAGLAEPAEAEELRIQILAEDFKSYGEEVIARLTNYAEKQPGWTIAPDNYEGVRVDCGDGWFLLRLSVHDPILPLNIESDSVGGVKIIRELLLRFLGQFDRLKMG